MGSHLSRQAMSSPDLGPNWSNYRGFAEVPPTGLPRRQGGSQPLPVASCQAHLPTLALAEVRTVRPVSTFR